MDIQIEFAYAKPNKISKLFEEYTKSIIKEGAKEISDTLKRQGYADELGRLEELYGLPEGRLYIANANSEPAGCIAMKKLEHDICEFKRLYVRPEYRGLGIAKALMDRIIDDARGVGYKCARLDTFPFMVDGIKMYRRYGFYDIARYNDNVAPTAMFMQLDL